VVRGGTKATTIASPTITSSLTPATIASQYARAPASVTPVAAGAARPETLAASTISSPFAIAPTAKTSQKKQAVKGAKTAESWATPEQTQQQAAEQERNAVLTETERAQQELAAKKLGEAGAYQTAVEGGGQTKAQADFNAMLLGNLLPQEAAAEQKRLGALEKRLGAERAAAAAAAAPEAFTGLAETTLERSMQEMARREAQRREDEERRRWEQTQREAQQQQESGYEPEYDGYY
jgi:hypothetical protein